jgi:creatinine amidohydrolase
MTEDRMDEVRLDRLRPAGIEQAMARAPIAWVPLGALEYHAEHLPNGADGITGQGLLERAARLVGGVVLPWSYLTMGTLALPWSFRYDPALVAEALRQTLRQLPVHGARVAVVHTGHAPLDLDHLVKRVCAEVEGEGIGLRAMGLTYLELNAALGTGLGTDWPVAVDHAAAMETSWIAALAPDLVATDVLPDDRAATILGVYGPNPRFTADAARGDAQIDAAAALLAERALALVRGEPHDPFADLRTFVERYWPEPLTLAGRAGRADEAALLLSNPGPVSRYLTGMAVRIDGHDVPVDGLLLRNPTAGETGVTSRAAGLGPEHGFYVRRLQTAEVTLPVAVDPGSHDVALLVGLAGVTETTYRQSVRFA